MTSERDLIDSIRQSAQFDTETAVELQAIRHNISEHIDLPLDEESTVIAGLDDIISHRQQAASAIFAWVSCIEMKS